MKRSITGPAWCALVSMALAACGGQTAPAAPASQAATSAATRVSQAPASAAPASQAPTSAAASTAAGQAAKPVSSASASSAAGAAYKVGLLTSLTGPYAVLGTPTKDTIDLEAKQLNAAGGINGRPVQVLVEDDQSDPTKGVVAFKKIADEKPVAMLGPIFASTALAIMPALEQAKLPAIGWGALQAEVSPVRKYFFMISPTAPLMAQNLLSYMKQTNITKVAVIHDPTAYGMEGPKAVKDAGGQYGVTTVEDETYNLTDTDMTAQLTKIKNNPSVQAVVLWGSGPAPIVVTKEYRALGIKLPLFASASQADESFIKASGPAAEGVIMDTNKLQIYDYLPADDPSRKILADFIPRYTQATGKQPNEFSAISYDAFHMLVDGIKRAGSTDPDSVAAALEQSKFDGADGPFEYSATNHGGMTLAALAMVQVKDGKFAPIKPNCDGCAATTVPKAA